MQSEQGTHSHFRSRIPFLLAAALWVAATTCRSNEPNKPPPAADLTKALHEAVKAGHIGRITSLLSQGADVNAKDKDGATPLHLATTRDVADLLISKGADVNAKGPDGWTPLHSAAAEGHADVAELLIAKGADVDAKDDDDYPPLLLALWDNHRDVIRMLVAHGAGVNFVAKDDWPFLHYPVWNNDRELVELFLAHGAKLDAKDNSGQTALRVAVARGHRDLVERLASKGAEAPAFHLAACLGNLDSVKKSLEEGTAVDAKDELGWTALYWAVSTGREEVAEFVVSKGADVAVRTKDNRTLLHQAAQSGAAQLADLLISKAADSNARDENNRTPLHLAAAGGHKSIVELLLARGAEVNAKDYDGRTPLSYAKEKGHAETADLLQQHGGVETRYKPELVEALLQAAATGNVEEVKSLISRGANPNAQDWRPTPLHMAAQGNDKPLAEFLIAAGAKVNAKNAAGDTPLHYAAVYGHRDMADMLIAKGADANARDALGYTPLHSAASGGHQDVAELLLAKGANINAVQAQGMTPLHEAAKWGQVNAAKLLVEKGANTEAKDKEGRTPLWYAKAGRNEEIAKLLPWHGPGHDVTLTNVSVPSSCAQGDHVSIVGHVANRSDYSETVVLKLTDVADAKTIGTKTVHLSPRGVEGVDDVPDLIFASPTVGRDWFGLYEACAGDVNGDGYNDLIIAAPTWNNEKGRASLYYGGPRMDANPDKVFEGENAGDRFGQDICLADVNGDGFADVIVGAVRHNNLRCCVYIFHGGPDMNLKCNLIIDGEEGTAGRFGRIMDAADVDNDGYEDLLIAAPISDTKAWKGRAYLYYGGDPMDTNCDKVFEGENPGDGFGINARMGGDVDGDNYRDVLIGATSYPSENLWRGRAYLYYGGDRANMHTTPDVVFDCPESGRSEFGYVEMSDIDRDGHADVLIGARVAAGGRGRVYLYWGGKRENMDAVPDKVFTGEADGRPNLAGNRIRCGRFNNDEYPDIAVAGYSWYRANDMGTIHIFYGGPRTLIDESMDKLLTGPLRSTFGKCFSIGDLNGDGYDDIVGGGNTYDNDQGRAWLFYGSPGDSTELKFDWNTAGASIGKHTLKAEIVPVAGEENTADNTMTVTVDVKERPK